MLMWILTSGAIAAFSALTLELMRDSDATLRGSRQQAGLRFDWESMTDSDIECLLEEFRIEEDEPEKPLTQLAA